MTELAKAELLNNWFFRGTVSHWFLFSSFSSHACNHQSDHMCVTPWDFNWSRSKIQCLSEESEIGRWNTTASTSVSQACSPEVQAVKQGEEMHSSGGNNQLPPSLRAWTTPGLCHNSAELLCLLLFYLIFFPTRSFCLMQCFRSVNNCVYTAGFM